MALVLEKSCYLFCLKLFEFYDFAFRYLFGWLIRNSDTKIVFPYPIKMLN